MLVKSLRKAGCEACNGSGYKGRVAIHELLINTDGIKKMIRHKAAMEDLRGAALAGGMKTLLMDGIDKIIQGHTDLSEVLQVCRHEKNVG